MMRRAITVLALACVLAGGASAATAAGAASDSPSRAINDCYANSRLTAQYSVSTLRAALAQMPADIREYSDCFDVIERQLFKQLSAKSGSATPGTSSSGSSFLPTWLIVVIVVLALAAITFGALAIRRRGGGPGGPGAPGGPAAPGSGTPGSATPGAGTTGPGTTGSPGEGGPPDAGGSGAPGDPPVT